MNIKMHWRNAFILFVALNALTATLAFAETAQQISCEKAIKDLRAMNEAHNVIMSNMANTYESVATAMNIHADAFKQVLKNKDQIKVSDLKVLDQSSQAYRRAGQQTKVLVQKYNQSANELMARMERCLTGSLAKNQVKSHSKTVAKR